MDIKELIEQITASGKQYGMFYFTLQEMNSPMYATTVDCNGKEVARCDYFGPSWEEKFMRKTDDVIAFLFDCDIHLWRLVSCDIQHVNCDGLVTTWNITLRR